MFLNIDQYAHNIETGEDFFYLEFGLNEFLNYGDIGVIDQIQISQNELFLIQKKDEKYKHLTIYSYEDGFKELRKIHV